MTYSTGLSTRSPRFSSAKKICDRSTVSTAQPMSRLRVRRPSARASMSAVCIAFSPRNSSQIRQARRSRRRRMLQHDPHQVVPLPGPFAAEDGLLAGVVAGGDLGEGLVVETPAGEGAGGLLDIVPRCNGRCRAEELHQLAGQVLIRVALAIAWGVEPHQERRVVDGGAQQFAERPTAELAEQFVLPPHERRGPRP